MTRAILRRLGNTLDWGFFLCHFAAYGLPRVIDAVRHVTGRIGLPVEGPLDPRRRYFFSLQQVRRSTIEGLLRDLTRAGLARESVCFICSTSDCDALGLADDRTVCLEQAWTSIETDVAIHEAWIQLKRQRCEFFRELGLADMMASVEVEYSTLEITLRRLNWAIDQAVSSDCRAVVCTSAHLPEFLIRRLIRGRDDLCLIATEADSDETVRRQPATRITLPRVVRHALGDLAAKQRQWELKRLTRWLIDTHPQVIVSSARPDTNYWQSVVAVIEEGRKRSRSSLILTSSWRTWLECRRQGIQVAISPARRRPELSPSPDIVEFLARASELAERRERYPAEAAALSWLLSGTCSARLALAAEERSFIGKVLDELVGCSILLLPHWNDFTSWAAMEARARGWKVVSPPIVTVAGRHASIMGWESIDIIPAYGEQCVEAFMALGYERDRLPAIGNISFDALLRRDVAAARVEVERAVGAPLAAGKRVVVIATSQIDPAEGVWVSKLAKLCEQHFDAILLQKLHPTFARARVNRNASAHCIMRCGAVEDAIAVADVVITDCSTSGVQAILMGKPLLVVNLTGQPFYTNDYAAMGVARAVYNIEDLGPVVSEALEGRSRCEAGALEAFTRRYNHPNDGRAASRLCEILAGCDDSAPGLSKGTTHG